MDSRESIMSVTVQTLTKYTVRTPGKVSLRDETEQTAWVVPALLFAPRYVSDARYRVGD